MKCNKVKLDRIKAMMLIAKAKICNNFVCKEKRYYFCKECNAYHTTSN